MTRPMTLISRPGRAARIAEIADQLNLTAVADAEACSDVEVFAHGVRSTFAELAEPPVIADP